MHVLILADSSFAMREHSLLSRLEIGLADEGIRVAHAVPEDCRIEAAPGIYSLSLKYEQHGTVFSRAARAGRLVEALGRAQGDEENTLDMVHAFGADSWALAMDVGRQTGAKVALEVWSGALVHRAVSLAAGPVDADSAPALLAPGNVLAGLLRKAAPAARVFFTPWGVATPDVFHIPLEPGRAPAATVMATGTDADLVGAALEGLAEAARHAPDLVVFLDGQAGDRPGVWKRARRLKLLDRLTVVADLEVCREPILGTDLLLHPECFGEHRSLILSAMAAGVMVIARQDPLVESLSNPDSAMLVSGPSPIAWAEAINTALQHPDRARSITARAREYVREQHSLTGHIRSVCAAYESIRNVPAMAAESDRAR
jgi:hypothetical protein